MFKSNTVIFTILIMFFTVLACNRVADISGDATVSEITDEQSGDIKVSELTDEQSDDLCEHLDVILEKFANDDAVQKGSCLVSGAMNAVFGVEGEDEQIAACETGFEECMEQKGEDDVSFADNCFDEVDLESCEATVKEVDACVTAMLDAQVEEMEKLAAHDCEEIMTTNILDDLLAGVGYVDEVEECKIVDQKCEMMR